MIQLCTEKEVRDMKKYVKLFFSLMVCFTLSFSLYSVVSALEEPTVTDNSETVVEEIPEDSTLTDEPEETTEITTPEETDPSTEQTTAFSEEENNNEEEATTEEDTDEVEESSIPTGTGTPVVSGQDYDVSKSKTATELDENYQTRVTLSLPSAETTPVTDIVFVLDRSSSTTNKGVRDSINSMLNELVGITDTSDAEIRVGVVGFDYQAYVLQDLTELNSNTISSIQKSVTDQTVSGTNIQAGIQAGSSMLAADTAVPNSNKYLILVTDGISHAWNDASGNPTTVWAQGMSDFLVVQNGANSYLYFDTTKSDFNDVYNLSSTDSQLNSGYEVPVYNADGTEVVADDLTENQYIKIDEYDQYLTGTEKGVYTAAHAYADVASTYNCITVYWRNSDYPIATQFMDWTASGNAGNSVGYNIDSIDVTEAFQNIKRELLYAVDAGSVVEDYMGYVKGEYNFDFVNDASAMNIQVGNESYEAVQINDNTYGFKPYEDGEYGFVLEYIAGEGAKEHFVWRINEPISNLARVSLTYTLKLTNPKIEAGTYGQYDANGSLGYDGLYTNNSATLYPVDTNGQPGEAEEFTKPTVSYTVEEEPKEPTKPEEEKPEKPDKKDPEKNKGADTATQTNMGLMLSLASMAVSGAFILVILQKKRA